MALSSIVFTNKNSDRRKRSKLEPSKLQVLTFWLVDFLIKPRSSHRELYGCIRSLWLDAQTCNCKLNKLINFRYRPEEQFLCFLSNLKLIAEYENFTKKLSYIDEFRILKSVNSIPWIEAAKSPLKNFVLKSFWYRLFKGTFLVKLFKKKN